MNIFEEVKHLRLPLGTYVVVGSGPLAARGLRAFRDIDLVVTEEVLQQLLADGWEQTVGHQDRPRATKGIFEAYRDLKHETYQPETERLIREADVIEGIPFIKLEELMTFKRAVGREKDLADIQLIETYLATH